MRLTDAGMLGFAEVNPGRVGYTLWYSQCNLDAFHDPLADLGTASTPWEELQWEEGVEAPLRPSLRHSPTEWQRPAAELPSPEFMEAWASLDDVRKDREELTEELLLERVRKEEQRVEAERQRKEEARARQILNQQRAAKARATRERRRERREHNKRMLADLRRPQQELQEACEREGGHVPRALSNYCLLCRAVLG